MRMRERLWPLILTAAGCFSEPVTSAGECVPGKPGCDCRVGQQCDGGLHCVESIDKCVPDECMPGAATCTCVDDGAGTCAGLLECRGGVCLVPVDDDDTGIADTSSAGTEQSSTTIGSSTTPITDTLTSSDTSVLTDTLDGSSTIDPTGVLESSSTGEPIDCRKCLQDAALDDCSAQFSTCTANDGNDTCNALVQCVFEETGTIAECCEQYDGSMSHLQWNAFALCADAATCQGMCNSTCPV